MNCAQESHMPLWVRVILAFFLTTCVACHNSATLTLSAPSSDVPNPKDLTGQKPRSVGAALKTHGQLRETFEVLTGVEMPNATYFPLVPHLPHLQDLQGLTGASQAAIFRLASEHCALVVSDAHASEAGKLFGVTPSDAAFDAQQIDLLVSRSMALWPQPSEKVATEFRNTLKDILALAPTGVTQRAMVLAACTATLASAHVTLH